VVTPAAKRRAVAQLVEQHRMSKRRACKTIGYCRMTIRYETSRDNDQCLRERIMALTHETPPFGLLTLPSAAQTRGIM